MQINIHLDKDTSNSSSDETVDFFNSLREQLEFANYSAQLSTPPNKFGTLQSLDPSTMSLIVLIATSPVVTAAITGVFNVIIEKLKNGKQNKKIKIVVGKNSCEISGETSHDEVAKYVQLLGSDSLHE